MAIPVPACNDGPNELLRKILLGLPEVGGGGGGGNPLEIDDEGVPLTLAATSIDFVGAGVTATAVGTDVTVTISGVPQGPAGGALGGTYPNPTIATGGSGNFTPGSVIFAGATGGLAEDNPNFFWDNTDNDLRLGTTTDLGAQLTQVIDVATEKGHVIRQAAVQTAMALELQTSAGAPYLRAVSGAALSLFRVGQGNSLNDVSSILDITGADNQNEKLFFVRNSGSGVAAGEPNAIGFVAGLGGSMSFGQVGMAALLVNNTQVNVWSVGPGITEMFIFLNVFIQNNKSINSGSTFGETVQLMKFNVFNNLEVGPKYNDTKAYGLDFYVDSPTGTWNWRISSTGIKMSLSGFGDLTMTPAVRTSGSPTLFTITAPAHTTLAAGTEASDVFWNLTRTVQFSTGAITAQRAVKIGRPTYAFVAASTITDAASFYVAGAPIAGTNATITRTNAIWSDGNLMVSETGVPSRNIQLITTDGGAGLLYIYSTGVTSFEVGTLFAGSSTTIIGQTSIKFSHATQTQFLTLTGSAGVLFSTGNGGFYEFRSGDNNGNAQFISNHNSAVAPATLASWQRQSVNQIYFTATGSIVIDIVGSGYRTKEGANAKQGVDTLVGGTVVVANTSVTAVSRIFLTGQNSSGTAGELTISARTAGTSFTVTSNNVLDTRDFAYEIFEPA